jgi:dsDNA-specific endonuclease/ATPase MutS2
VPRAPAGWVPQWKQSASLLDAELRLRFAAALAAVTPDVFEEPLNIETTVHPVIGIHRPRERAVRV